MEMKMMMLVLMMLVAVGVRMNKVCGIGEGKAIEGARPFEAKQGSEGQVIVPGEQAVDVDDENLCNRSCTDYTECNYQTEQERCVLFGSCDDEDGFCADPCQPRYTCTQSSDCTTEGSHKLCTEIEEVICGQGTGYCL